MDGITLVIDPAAYKGYRTYIAEAFEAMRFKKLMERFCAEHPEICNGVEREFPPVIEPPVYELSAASAISELLGSVGFIGPDQEGGPNPKGPGGPVMHDMLATLSILQLSGAISDREAALQVRKVAADLVQRQAAQLQVAIAQ